MVAIRVEAVPNYEVKFYTYHVKAGTVNKSRTVPSQ